MAAIVEHLTTGHVTWTDRHGATRKLTLKDILIVAPYNAQVAALSDRFTAVDATGSENDGEFELDQAGRVIALRTEIMGADARFARL